MYDGLWTIEFRSSNNFFGSGVLILTNGRLLGGDYGYYYSGSYEINGEELRGKVSIIRFDPNSISVFGEVDNFSLDLKGTIKDYEFRADAYVIGNSGKTLHIVGKKREEL